MAECIVGNSVVPLLAGADRDAFYIDVLVSLSGGDLRVRTDGPAPSTTSGVQLYDGNTYTYPRRFALRALMVAAVAGTPVTVLVEGR